MLGYGYSTTCSDIFRQTNHDKPILFKLLSSRLFLHSAIPPAVSLPSWTADTTRKHGTVQVRLWHGPAVHCTSGLAPTYEGTCQTSNGDFLEICPYIWGLKSQTLAAWPFATSLLLAAFVIILLPTGDDFL